MDWQALALSLELAAATLLVLLPAGLWLGRWLANTRFAGKSWIEAVVVLPLVLPPTVLGYYLLVSLGGASPVGAWMQRTLGLQLTFSFSGLLIASVIFKIPFIVQPVQRAFEAIPRSLGEAAAVSGLSAWQTFWRV
ncbi:MAG TPA: ABC transporter permease subunit [Rubrivivax sp.]|nr:ABC transporter permease subunit [Rubrivivax sp.]